MLKVKMVRMGFVYTKNQTQDIKDHIGGIYVASQNERMRQIVWVSSTPKNKKQKT